MKLEIKIPSMGESVTEATISSILKRSGSWVEMDEELLEVETDKVNQVLYAPQAGLLELTVVEGQTIKIGAVIGLIDSKGAAPKNTPKQTPKPILEPAPVSAPIPAKVHARIQMEDFVKGLQQEVVTTTPVAVESGVRETRKPLSRIRQTIAKHLVQAKQETAMLTTFNEVDMSAVIKLRTTVQEDFVAKHGVKLGFMSLFIKASVNALKKIPEINTYLDGDDLVQRHTYDIGIAVSSERGLVVPVLRDCDRHTSAQIEKNLSEYARKAREGGLRIEDLKGGGFTITNGGIFGSLLSTPILNPPQSAILGMHAIQDRPVAINGVVCIRPMMYLAVSYDHRIVDGKEAVTFLIKIKEGIENPALLFLDL